MACATPVGDQGLNLGRNAVLAAGWPETVPATTLDRQGAGSLQAALFAAHGVAAGAYEVVVAAGVEVSTTTPAGAWVVPGTSPFGPRVGRRYAEVGGLVPPGVAAERVAARWGLSRRDLDHYALRSHERARAAVDDGRTGPELVTVGARRWDRERRAVVESDGVVSTDEGVAGAVTMEDLARFKPMYEPDGLVTAGNSAPAADGAAAVLVMAEPLADSLGLRSLVRFVGGAGAGIDPGTMLTGTVAATAAALADADLAIDDVDCFEIDEWFAPAALAWMAEHRADPSRVNVNGGAIAVGSAPGCSGARLLTTLVHELDRRSGRFGLVALDGVGGVATAAVVERI